MDNPAEEPRYRPLTKAETAQASREDDELRMSLTSDVLQEIERGIMAHEILEGTMEIERITEDDDTTPFGIWRNRS